MADMKKEFTKLAGTAFDELIQFISFFTVKRILTLLIVGLALIAVCGPTDVPLGMTNNQPPCDTSCPFPKPVPPPIHKETFSQENWSVTLIGDGWSPRPQVADEIKLAMQNRDQTCLVFVVKEKTDDSYGAYVVSTIRGFVESGGLIDSVEMVMVNGERWCLTQVDHSDEVIWLWVLVKDGFGYGFTCGCELNPDAGASQYRLCQSMMDTFQLK